MTGKKAETTFGRWTAPQIGLTIEYQLDVMEDIRAKACESARQFSGGSLDIGGVLFGKHEYDRVRILAWRPIPCEHAEGPSLSLSADDRRGLVGLLLSAKQDPGLETLQPVGWFLSNMRGGISLKPPDVEIFDGYFGEPWQVTLVLLPTPAGTARAGFFVRETAGEMRSESSYREFSIQPPETVASPPPSFKVLKRPRDIRWLWAIPTVIAIILAGLLIKPQPPAPPSEGFSLRIQDHGSVAQINWDRNSKTVSAASRAEIEIQDGGPPSHLQLTAAQLQEGKISFERRTGNVEVSMTVHIAGGAVREYARFEIKTISLPPAPQADSHDAELKKLKEELRQQRVRADKMQNMVKILENRMSIDRPRKP